MSNPESPQPDLNQQELSREVTAAEKTRIKKISAQIEEILRQFDNVNLDNITEEQFNQLDLKAQERLIILSERLKNLVSGESQLPPEVLTQMKEAEAIFGHDFLGLEEIQAAFHLNYVDMEVPPIPFSKEELERAKELDQFLILRQPLTIKEMNERLDGKFNDGLRFLYDFKEGTLRGDCWYKDENFYNLEQIRSGWALVTKDLLTSSRGVNYLNQISTIIRYLNNEIFENIPIPQNFQQAIKEYTEQKDEIEILLKTDTKTDTEEACQRLENLKINQLTRQTPAEAVYDLTAYYQCLNFRLLDRDFAWTGCQESTGGLIEVGFLEENGIIISKNSAEWSPSNVGVCFSRRQ